jgi:predicted nucleotidyltransferase
MDVKIYLEDLYLRKIDLVLEETIKPGLRPQILEEVVYASGL